MTFSIFLLAIAGNAEGLIPIDNLSQYYGDHGNITALTLTENSIPEIKDVEFYRNHTQAITTPDYLVYIGIVEDLKPTEYGDLVEFSSGDYRYFQKGIEPEIIRMDPNPNYGYFEKGKINIIIQKFNSALLDTSREQYTIEELRVIIPPQERLP